MYVKAIASQTLDIFEIQCIFCNIKLVCTFCMSVHLNILCTGLRYFKVYRTLVVSNLATTVQHKTNNIETSAATT